MDGNRRLTAALGALLLVLLAIEGGTIPFLGSLEPVHVFVGFVLIPVVAFKLSSTLYRVLRYYTGAPAYRRAGPPPLVLRMLGPVVVLSTVALLGTGLALAVMGHDAYGVKGLHQASSVIWFGAMTVHVLAHVLSLPRRLAADWTRRDGLGGAGLRRALPVVVLAVGLIAAAMAMQVLPAWHGHHHYH